MPWWLPFFRQEQSPALCHIYKLWLWTLHSVCHGSREAKTDAPKSHALLLPWALTAAAFHCCHKPLPCPAHRAWISVLCISNVVVQSSKVGAVHDSLSPGQVTAESHLAYVLPLLRYSDCFHPGMPPWVLKFAFHGPSAGLNSVAAELAECNTEGQLQILLGDRRRAPGFQQVIDPAYRRELSKLCTLALPVMRNNSNHPWLKPNALGSHSPKGKWCLCLV